MDFRAVRFRSLSPACKDNQMHQMQARGWALSPSWHPEEQKESPNHPNTSLLCLLTPLFPGPWVTLSRVTELGVAPGAEREAELFCNSLPWGRVTPHRRTPPERCGRHGGDQMN